MIVIYCPSCGGMSIYLVSSSDYGYEYRCYRCGVEFTIVGDA
jgi:predicted RNA-binding Zn-ribbon protein involved in translation (DUF1610 family)